VAKFILDTRLSDDHYVVCQEAIRRNIIEPWDLNEGRRLLSEQAAFYAAYLRFLAGGPRAPLAAKPLPGAPHIKWGRRNHAIDCNDGASDRLAAFYRELGVPAVFNVAGEPWHIDFPDAAALKRAADRIREANASIRPGERDEKVKYLKHRLHVVRDPQTGRAYLRADKPRGGWSTFYSPDVVQAIRAFQRDRKWLQADGVVGPATEKALKRAYKAAQRKARAK
jgi:hypothetical protein